MTMRKGRVSMIEVCEKCMNEMMPGDAALVDGAPLSVNNRFWHPRCYEKGDETKK